jgi:hydantoinase/carbamoylase family amidase
MKVNGQRLLNDLKYLRTLTDTPDAGVTRFSYGEMDRQARIHLHEIADAIGATWHQDGVGNVRIGLPGNRPGQKTILAGSHIDSVRNGGWLDGVYGSVSALEVLRILAESGRTFGKNYEVVFFAEEEGSNFDSTLTGSKFIADVYGPEQLDHLKNSAGVTLREMLAGMPFAPESASTKVGGTMAAGANPVPAAEDLPRLPWDFSNIEAMVEMHIEQGPVLEREGIGIGIVDSIFGMRLVEFELTGLGNHAGGSPMEGRRDALAAAAACILIVEKLASRASGHRGLGGLGLGGKGLGVRDSASRPVATAGKLQVFPNCTNVIPEKVVFTVETRHNDDQVIDSLMNDIIEAILEECEERQVGMSVREVAKNKAILLPQAMVKRMTEIADRSGLDFQVMGSGAVHDSSMMAQFVDTGMIFVPSIGGRSHVKEEDTKENDLVSGANLLLEVVLSLME